MPKPKKPSLPPWLKGATLVNAGTLTINSINAVGTNPRGAGFSYKLTYQAALDRWLQGLFPPGGFAGTSRIEVNFTFKNTSYRTVSGSVGGFIDQVALAPDPIAPLANGASASGKVSFHPFNVTGDHVILLTFREPVPGPIVPISLVLAQTTANYSVF